MTTNSPNPVDGDVQVLIADCQTEIEDLKRSIDRCDAIGTSDYLHHLQSKLKRQYAALASLTAEPAVWVSKSELDLVKPKNNRCVEATLWGIERFNDQPLYTAPPAQLLRPVELPKKSDVKMGGDAKTRALLTGMNMMLKSCTEALRQQGYEVKND